MDKLVRRKLRAAGWRCGANRLLACLNWSMLIAGGVTLGIAVLEKLLATGMVFGQFAAWLACAGALGALISWWLLRPKAMQLAVMLDERAALRERVSSMLAFGNSSDPFARAAVEESRKSVSAVRPSDHFPVRPPRNFWQPLGIWALAVVCWLFLPQGDLLGKLAAKDKEGEKQKQVQQTRALAQSAAKRVKALSEKIDQNLPIEIEPSGDLTKELASVKEPQQARRLAVRQISELRKRVEQSRADSRFKGLEQFRRKLRQLRSPDSGHLREFSRQLSRGQFDKAAASLRELREKLKQKDLSQAQRAQLAKQLDELAQQLEKLAKQQWQMKNELKKLGLDPKLAGDLEKLKEALDKLALDPEKKRKLLELAKSSCSASKSCSGLGNTLSAAAAGLAGVMDGQAALGALADAAEQLTALEALSQQLQLAEATLVDLDQALQSLCQGQGGCAACQGLGCSLCGGKGPWRPGLSQNRSMGMGGPGRKTGQGPTIASWYIQDRLVKGESRKSFSEVVQNTQREVSEAIETQRIPKQYHRSVKQYFGKLSDASNGTAGKAEQ